MSFKPHWSYQRTGWFDFPAHAICLHCKEPLRKRHGLNRDQYGKEIQMVRGCCLFGVAPFCIHCATKAWTDPDFFSRSGHSEYNARRWNLEGTKL